MSQFRILIKKEWLEATRDFKWLWMPIVFILIGIMEPLTAFYTPEIIEKFGGLPEGAIIELPLPTAGEVLVRTMGQYNLFGALIIVLAFMGVLAAERESGTAAMILVKPVSFRAFIAAKWLHGLILVWVSYLLGICAAWYYTYQLFDLVDPLNFFAGSLSFGIWLTFIFTLTIFFSSFSSKAGIAAFGTLAITIILTFISSLMPGKFSWSPFALAGYASELWLGESLGNHLFIALLVTLAIIVMLILLAIHMFKRKELV